MSQCSSGVVPPHWANKDGDSADEGDWSVLGYPSLYYLVQAGCVEFGGVGGMLQGLVLCGVIDAYPSHIRCRHVRKGLTWRGCPNVHWSGKCMPRHAT